MRCSLKWILALGRNWISERGRIDGIFATRVHHTALPGIVSSLSSQDTVTWLERQQRTARKQIMKRISLWLCILTACVALVGCSGAALDSAPMASAVQSVVGAPATAIVVDLSFNQIGRPTTQGNGVFRTFHQYDARGRAVRTQHVIGDSSYLYIKTYGNPSGTADDNGPVVVGSTFPDGEQVTYRYDAAWMQQAVQTQACTAYDAGNHCTAHEAVKTIIQSITRNARGETLSVVHGDGTTSTRTYNDQSDLHLRRLQTAVTATPALLRQSFEYAYDSNGNFTGVTDYCNEATTADCSATTPDSTFTASYIYDSINQVIGGTWSYGYDDFGNLTSKEGNAQCYGTGCGVSGTRGPHALARDGANLAYQYDGNGNLISRSDGLAIAWNAVNLPTSIGGGPVAATSKYYVDTTLIKMVQGGATTYYLPDMRIENGGAIKYFSGYAERSTDGALRFYHRDHLGSSTLVTDASGSVVHRQAYTPFGEDRVAPPAGSFTVAAGLRHQFNFKEKAQNGSGFYDYGARLYNPATGRWLSPDSAQTGNRYTYVRNNPLGYTDSTGHYEEPVHGALIYILAQAAGFTEHDAEIIAIASAGVDHDPKTQPLNPLATREWHFDENAGPAKLQKQLDIARTQGGDKMDLYELGRAFHSIADVSYLGPHDHGMRGNCIVVPCHPIGPMEDDSWSWNLGHHTDQAFRNPVRNNAQFFILLDRLIMAADAKYGERPNQVNNALAHHAMDQVIAANTEAKIEQFFRDTGWYVVLQRNNESKVDPRVVQWTTPDYTVK